MITYILFIVQGEMEMKISFSTLGCPRWTWKEIIATAADLGFQGVEIRGIGSDISAPTIPEFTDEKLSNTKSELNRLQLTIPCLNSDCCIHIRNNEKAIEEELKAYIHLAQKLDAPFVRLFATAPVPHPMGNVDEGYIKERAIILGEYAQKHQVKLLIETHGVWSESDKLAKLMQSINCEGVGVLWDIHHPYRFFNESPETTFQALSPWLCHIHIKDGVKTPTGYAYALPGFGDIPIEKTVSVLQAGGYKGYYSLEWLKRWDNTLEEPGIVFAHYSNYMNSLL